MNIWFHLQSTVDKRSFRFLINSIKKVWGGGSPERGGYRELLPKTDTTAVLSWLGGGTGMPPRMTQKLERKKTHIRLSLDRKMLPPLQVRLPSFLLQTFAVNNKRMGRFNNGNRRRWGDSEMKRLSSYLNILLVQLKMKDTLPHIIRVCWTQSWSSSIRALKDYGNLK